MYKKPWSELAGAAETLLATDGLRVRDIVRYAQIQLHFIGFPHSLAGRRSCFSEKTVCQRL